ncbi:SAM-dependent methyltransferase [Streptomyces sp. NPDC088789]|uniref:SAM-dependent methyltransferase n=1 Tax=Streptomyces sp. NPDC088789 TaxID=3365899 RepID=UPI0037FE8587
MSLPYGVDVTVPSVARMYDSLLGGQDNYPADRAACEVLLQQVPSMRELALNNRQFLRRVVHVLASQYGIRQFIDHGSGLPTLDNVHEIAQRVDPASRVVYIDNDPIVSRIGGALLATNENTAVLEADMRDTDEIFSSEPVSRLIARDEPVAALFVSVLHCLRDSDRPADLVARVADQLPDGSMMVVCQLVSSKPEVRDFVSQYMDQQTQGHWGRVRERRDVADFCAPLELIDPGLVEVSTWRPVSEDVPAQLTWEWEEFGGVGFVSR